MDKSAALGLLVDELCRIARRLAGDGISLIVAGGVGLLLRDQHIRETEAATLRAYPRLRATSDIDLFLSAEIISDEQKTQRIRRLLDELGYKPVETAKYYQFQRPLDDGAGLQVLKIDLLAPAAESDNVKITTRRIRPHGFNELHAHVTPEAVTVEEYLTRVSLDCEGGKGLVYLPHPFTYVVLKLFALRDRVDDPGKEYGRYHAFDIYVALSMMTEVEYEQAIELAKRFSGTPQLEEARSIVDEFFGDVAGLGVIRIREHVRAVSIPEDDLDLAGLVTDLADLF